MKASDDLFQLVKSLSMSEKRFFKLMSSLQVGDKGYMRLFDEMVKQKEYDENAIVSKFKHEKFINQFWVVKNYLYNAILKSLEGNNANIDFNLSSLVNQSDILFKKNLYDQCRKLIKKTKELSRKYEKPLYFLAATEMEVKLMRKESFVGITESKIDLLYKEIMESIKKYQGVIDYSFLSLQILHKMRQGTMPRTKNDLKAYKKMPSPLFKNEKGADSFYARYYLYNSKIAYYFVLQEYDNALSYTHKSLKEMEQSPHQIAKNPDIYVSVLSNQINCFLHLKKYKLAEQNIKKVQESEMIPENIKNSMRPRMYNLLLGIYDGTAEYEKGLVLVKEIEKSFLPFYAHKINKELLMSLYLNNSFIYFGLKKYKDANRNLQKIFDPVFTDFMQSYTFCFSKIFALLVHYELGNLDLLYYNTISTYRYLYRRKRLFKFETEILHFIRINSSGQNGKKDFAIELKKLREKLVKLNTDFFEKKAFDFFNFISWIDSKCK